MQDVDPSDWGPHPCDWSPPDWHVKMVPSAPAKSDVLAAHYQKPWATCPICKEFPEALYIDCREAHMKRKFKDPHTGKNVNVLPITYPFPNRVAAYNVNPYKAGCCCERPNQMSNNSSIVGAPKLVARAQQRKLLKRWSGHIPISMKYERGKKEAVPIPVPDARPKPLSAAEREVRHTCSPSLFEANPFF